MYQQPEINFSLDGLVFASIFLLGMAVLAVFGIVRFLKKSQHANRPSTVAVLGTFACIMAVFLFFVIAASFVGYQRVRKTEVATQIIATDQARQFAVAQQEKALRGASRYDVNNPDAVAPFDSASSESITVVAPKPKLTPPAVTIIKTSLPSWIKQGDVTAGDTTLKVISSGRFATVEESERQAIDEAQVLMREYFRQSHQASGYWKMPVELLQAAVRNYYTDEFEHNFGTFTETMYRTHLQLELSPEVRETFYQPWRSQIVEHRMWQLGYLLFFATFILGAITCYFRFDAYTNGAYRGRFKFATSLVIVGGSIALLCVA